MKPVPEWRRVLRHAWSIRFAALSVVFGAAGAGLDLIDAAHRIEHPVLIPVLGVAFAFAAGVARLVQQRHLSGDAP